MASLDEFAREQAILAGLKSAGQISVNDLGERFGVSTVTIRKDLDLLERRGLLRRVRGGAVSVGTSDEGAFDMRLRHRREAKESIAKAVAPLVRDGDVIAIDSSTSTYYLAQQILDRRNLVVVTNGLRHAVLFMEHSSAMVLMLGGVLRRSSASMVGPIGDVLAGRGRISAGFFGVVGASTHHGLMDLSAEEAQTKRFMATACDRVYGLYDSSKIGGFGLHSFADTASITGMFTDDEADPRVLTEWGDLGIPLTAVARDTRASPDAELTDIAAARTDHHRRPWTAAR